VSCSSAITGWPGGEKAAASACPPPAALGISPAGQVPATLRAALTPVRQAALIAAAHARADHNC
jgi:hypothetical protein